MKKTKMLVGTLALATAMMGTGYAYWHQTTSVDAVVTTANFGVVFDNIKGFNALADGTESEGTEQGTGLNNYYAAVTVETNAAEGSTKATEIDYEWNNIYPGTAAKFAFDIVNESSIPVWARPTVTSSGSEAVRAALKWTLKIDNTVVGTEATTLKACVEALKIELAKADGAASNADVKKVELIAELPTTVEDPEVIDKKLELNVNMNWSQFNEAESSESPKPSETPAPSEPAETPAN